MPFELPLGKGFKIFKCPITEIDKDALFLINLVNWSESVGVLPSGCGLLDESNLYFEARNFILREQAEIDQFFDSQNQSNSKRSNHHRR